MGSYDPVRLALHALFVSVLALCLNTAGGDMKIADKTLVVWCAPSNLDHRGAGVFGVEDLQEFDSIVLGEVRPRVWMAGSHLFRRTEAAQDSWPTETVASGTMVQVAVTWQGTRITLYREGQVVASYDRPQRDYGEGLRVSMGMRHCNAAGVPPTGAFGGVIDEAQFYAEALSAAQIAGLRPGGATPVRPLARWTFVDGSGRDEMGCFGPAVLRNGAEIRDGKLYLDGKDDYLITPVLRAPQVLYPATLAAQWAALATDPQVLAHQASRQRLAADPYRPAVHFAPPGGMMNDPNGPCFWQGNYHLFYQWVAPGGGPLLWGHACSTDLVNWRDLPVALRPDTEGNCFSGNTLVEPERVIALYHGTGSGNAIATASDPLLLNWEKHPANPVIPAVHTAADGSPYRIYDPCVWKDARGYWALSGTYKDGDFVKDCRLAEQLFFSTDLAHWEYRGVFVEDGFFTERGEDGAVPYVLPLGAEHLLLFASHRRGAQYYLGAIEPSGERFRIRRHGRFNYGPIGVGSLHAPAAFIDPQGRCIAFFNVREGRPATEWSDVMTLPRVLSLEADGTLGIRPAAEVERLRADPRAAAARELPANAEVVLDTRGGKSIEITAEIDPGAAREVCLSVLRSPDGAERTDIRVFFQTEHNWFGQYGQQRPCVLMVDGTRASLRDDVQARPPESGPLLLGAGEPLRLRVFVDRSIVEVFANDRQCLTLRVYPSRADSDTLALRVQGAAARLAALTVWDLAASANLAAAP
jgi:beta-fructofuranosidase